MHEPSVREGRDPPDRPRAGDAPRAAQPAPERGDAIALEVLGSGPVASAFALFARRQGFPARALGLARRRGPLPAGLAERVLALSLGSWQLLGRVALLPDAAPIRVVEVRVPGHPGRTRITAGDLGVPALGYTVRYGALLEALDAAVDAWLGSPEGEPTADPAGDARREAAVADRGPGGQTPVVTVHAEGDTGEDARTRSFRQSALLADVVCADDHGGTAFECFTAQGPLALLPLAPARRMSLVWCAPPAECARRAALGAGALAAELNAAFGATLGELRIAGAPAVAPLARRARRALARGDEVWIGNAAQALHPVAGQGLNLGLRDAFELARALGDAVHAGGDPAGALQRYARGRSLDRAATIGLTDLLASIFTAAPLRPVQSAALAALDLVPPLRAAVARRFMFGLR